VKERRATAALAVSGSAKLVQTDGLSGLGVLRSRSKPDGSVWRSLSHDGFERRARDGILWVRTPTAMLAARGSSRESPATSMPAGTQRQ